MLGRDRTSFDQVLQPLREAGYAIMAIDFRGHGQSGQKLNWEDFDQAAWQGILEDVRASIVALGRRRGVDADHLGIVGASIGANAALITGSAISQVRTAVLLSPGLDYRGLQPLTATGAWGNRPVLIAAAQNDAYSFDSSKQLAAALPKADLATLSGDAHGTNLFLADPIFVEKMANFLLQTLPTSTR